MFPVKNEELNKLEFYLQIYFAVYSIHPFVKKQPNQVKFVLLTYLFTLMLIIVNFKTKR
jgi:hypothetical protein